MTLTVNIPDELYQRAQAVADSQEVSVERLIAAALSDQLRVWDRFRIMASQSSRDKFLQAMSKVPDVEPEDADRW